MKNKQLGVFACSAIVAGNMMGSGIALLPANLAALGSITVISWILAIIGAIALAFVFAKLSATDPEEGGPVAYAGQIAPILGFQAGVLYFNANWIGNLAIAVTGVAYLSVFFPVLSHHIPAGIAAIAIIWFFATINLLGAHWVGKLVSVGVGLLLIPVILAGTAGWFFFKPHLFVENWNVAHGSSIHTVFAGTLLCIWSFIGIESAAVDANLVKDPAKTIPKATLIGVSIAAIVYFLSCTAISGMFPHNQLAQSTAPFSLTLGMMFGHWAAPVVSAIIAFACLASLSSWIMLVAQAGVKAAHDGTLPPIFAEVNAKGVPVKGILINATNMSLLMVLFTCLSGSTAHVFADIITTTVLMTILPYFYSALNLIDVVEHPIKHTVIAIVALVAMLFCLSAYIGAAHYALLSVTLASLLCLIFYVRKNREDFEKSIYRKVHHWSIKD